MVNRVLIIGGNKRVLERAKSLNIEILSIQQKSTCTDELLKLANHNYLVENYDDIDNIVNLAKKTYEEFPFRCAVSLNEFALVAEAYVNERLNLKGGNPVALVKLLRNKEIMRDFLNKRNISPVLYEVGSNLKDISNFIKKVNSSIIVKPLDGAGSLGIFKILDIKDAEEKFNKIKELKLNSFMMEEFLDGPEISVESFSFDGEHHVIAITDKFIQENFVEIGHAVPSQISPLLKDEVIKLVIEFLTAIGLKNGPSHTEIKLTSKGPRIVESHNRTGGDNITELVRISCGLDIITLTFQWACNLIKPIIKPITFNKGAAVRFIIPVPGVVKEFNGTEEVLASSYTEALHFNVSVGDRISPVRHSYDRAGYIIAYGQNTAEANKNCDELLKKIYIETKSDD